MKLTMLTDVLFDKYEPQKADILASYMQDTTYNLSNTHQKINFKIISKFLTLEFLFTKQMNRSTTTHHTSMSIIVKDIFDGALKRLQQRRQSVVVVIGAPSSNVVVEVVNQGAS